VWKLNALAGIVITKDNGNIANSNINNKPLNVKAIQAYSLYQ